MNIKTSTSLLIVFILNSYCCCCRAQLTHAAGIILEGNGPPSNYAFKIEDITTQTTTPIKQDLPRNNTNSLNLTERNERTDAVNAVIVASRNNELKQIGGNGAKPLGSFGNVMQRLWTCISTEFSESQSGDSDEMASRTFGAIRRLQIVLIPLVFKFGVLAAMIAMLVFLGLKTVFLLKILLMMNALALMGKLLTWKWKYVSNDENPQPIFRPLPIIAPGPSWAPNYMGWNPVPAYHGGWGSPPFHSEHHHPSKEVHLHIHGAQLASRSSSSENESHKIWDHPEGPSTIYETPPDGGKNGWEKHVYHESPLYPSIQTSYEK